jgi:hypothetical protein
MNLGFHSGPDSLDSTQVHGKRQAVIECHEIVKEGSLFKQGDRWRGKRWLFPFVVGEGDIATTMRLERPNKT